MQAPTVVWPPTRPTSASAVRPRSAWPAEVQGPRWKGDLGVSDGCWGSGPTGQGHHEARGGSATQPAGDSPGAGTRHDSQSEAPLPVELPCPLGWDGDESVGEASPCSPCPSLPAALLPREPGGLGVRGGHPARLSVARAHVLSALLCDRSGKDTGFAVLVTEFESPSA